VVDPPVPVIEGARVAAVQVAHAFVEVRLRRLDDQVEVIAHQTADVDLPLVTARDAAEQVNEEHPVLVVEDDRSVVVAACDDVVDGTGFEMAQRAAAHAATVAANL
jgi:hypothetical protein